MPTHFSETVIIIIVGVGLSAILVRMGIALAIRTGFVNHPNPIVKNHVRPVVLGGGIAVVIIVLVISAIFDKGAILSHYIPITIIPVFILGIIDDIYTLRPLTKLISQCITVIPYVVMTQATGWSTVLIIIFLVACQNAWNLTDVMDGLLGWIAIVTFTGIIAIAMILGIVNGSIIICSAAVVGSVAGFLIWNSHPARVYLGDAGSLSLGMLFGILVIELSDQEFVHGIPILLIGLIPFLETAFIITERIRKGLPVHRGSPDHFAMRLQCAGWRIPSIIYIIIAANVVLAIFACIFTLWPKNLYLILSGGLLLMILISLAYRYIKALPTWESQHHG